MKNNNNPESVTAAELVRSFPASRERAMREPVYISHHGRDSHVLIGIDKFNELFARQAGGEGSQSHLEGVSELAQWVDLAVLITNAEYEVVFSNRIAQALCRRTSMQLQGRSLLDSLPEIRNTLFDGQARRTLTSHEPAVVEFPSPFNPEAWLRLQTAPVGDYLVLIFRDISEDVKRYRLADVKTALLAALDVHGKVGYVRISPRGTIDRVDQPFTKMVGLPEERLLGLAITELFSRGSRGQFRESLNAVLAGEAPQRIEAELISNHGAGLQVVAGLASLHGTYGAEGAVLVVTAS